MQKHCSLSLIRGLNRYNGLGGDLVRSGDCCSVDLDVCEVIVPVVVGDSEREVGVGESCLGVYRSACDG